MTSEPVTITLRSVPVQELAQWHQGRPHASGGLSWHDEYPTADTFDIVGMLALSPTAGEPPWGLWQIVDDNEVIGDCGFHGPPDPDGTVEIGYQVVPQRQRNGIASEAVRQLLATAQSAGATFVLAEIRGNNPGSIGVVRRNGFQLVETQGDTAIWGRTLQGMCPR